MPKRLMLCKFQLKLYKICTRNCHYVKASVEQSPGEFMEQNLCAVEWHIKIYCMLSNGAVRKVEKLLQYMLDC